MKWVIEDMKAALYIGLFWTCLVIAGVLGFIVGKDEGRREYHLELIMEMDAKGDAPVLLYKNETWRKREARK